MLYTFADLVARLDPLWWAAVAGILFVLCCIAARHALGERPVDPITQRLAVREPPRLLMRGGDWRRRVTRVHG